MKMRKVAVLFAVFVSLMLVAPCFASLPPVTDGLVGCWDFDEGSGVTAVDSSGNGNHGLIVNATYTGDDIPSQELSGYSLVFNNWGGNAYSYVTIPDNSSLRPSSGLTLAAWVKAGTYEGRMRTIISKQLDASNGDSFVLWYHDDGNLWFDVGGVGHILIVQPPANEWHHIVGTYNGSFMRLYVDGVEKVSSVATGTIPYDNNPVLIGADSNQADHTPDAGWNGTIDDVLLYDRALNQEEVAILTGSSKLYGIIGNHLVTVNQNTGDATEVGIINASGLWGLTYDPYRNALYCVANQTTDPELVLIDQTTAKATTIGPIDLEGYSTTYLGFVEALAFNPVDGILYGSAGTTAYLSPMLIRIDPATGNATQIASITGTTENDGDSLVFINGALYSVDTAPYSTLYTVNLGTGVATNVGDLNDFRDVILAYNPETQTLLGSARADRLLIEISRFTGQCTDIGPTHTADEFEGALLGSMAVVFDGRPPDIEIPTQDPSANNVQPYQNVTISVNVTDNLSGVKNVTLTYSLDNGTTWEPPESMNLNTTSNLYEGTIPGQPMGTEVRFKIVAFDNADNSVTEDGTSVDYTYIVVPELNTLIVIPAFMIATLLAVTVYRKKHSV